MLLEDDLEQLIPPKYELVSNHRVVCVHRNFGVRLDPLDIDPVLRYVNILHKRPSREVQQHESLENYIRCVNQHAFSRER